MNPTPRYCPKCAAQVDVALETIGGETVERRITMEDAGGPTETPWSVHVPGARAAHRWEGHGRNAERVEQYFVPLRMCWNCETAIPEPLTTVVPHRPSRPE